MDDPLDGCNDERGLSAYKIYRHLEASLKRLQTDHVELYQMHHIDRAVSWEELWGALESMVNQGKVYYIGSSNFAGWHLVEAQYKARERNFLGLISEQHKYNLFVREPELEVLPAAKHLGIGVLPYNPLAKGLLGGKILEKEKNGQITSETTRIQLGRYREKITAYYKLCNEMGETADNVSLGWLLNNEAVTAPIIGPRTFEQLISANRALEIKFTPELLANIDALFPGPGKPAPEAYSW
jgi:aryl-alcohol dehydrogenase-like predicted oxidoreductase